MTHKDIGSSDAAAASSNIQDRTPQRTCSSSIDTHYEVCNTVRTTFRTAPCGVGCELSFLVYICFVFIFGTIKRMLNQLFSVCSVPTARYCNYHWATVILKKT